MVARLDRLHRLAEPVAGTISSSTDSGWPMLGRDTEHACLTTALTEALAGRTAFAAVTGEPETVPVSID